MKVIDQELGGTTPFDVILDLENMEEQVSQTDLAAGSVEEDEFDEFEEEFEETRHEAKYWFTSDKMEQVEKVHDYLDSIPETGKVMSLGTMLKVGKTLNDGKPLDNFLLALLYEELPERFRKIVIDPYVSVENNQVRFSIRVRDSEPNLRRDELLKRIKRDLPGKLELENEKVHLTGLLVLYNNMLQSLFDSQILTLGAVASALMFMFLILFRSLKIALIAIFPNILSISFVLGFMGWAKIPLDMMTITIASISMGIAVDDTIHYIHRFREEFIKDRNYLATMHRCHGSIGYAMYYTTVTIIIGFSILVLSNFVPSIYFGLLTGLAMVIALLAALTLLPQLIIFIKPLGPEESSGKSPVPRAIFKAAGGNEGNKR
ncbi:MAG: RND family transporter [Desulfobacterales bacterium]